MSCSAPLDIAPQMVQQVDVREPPPSNLEHRSHPGFCPHCQKLYETPLPPAIVRGGLVGQVVRLPQGGLPRFVLDRPRAPPRRRAGDELARRTGADHRQGQPGVGAPLTGVARRPPGQVRLNVDETGHKQNGDRQWTWCFRAALYTLLKIDPTRIADVRIDVPGAEYDRMPGCDDFSTYPRYQRACGGLLKRATQSQCNRGGVPRLFPISGQGAAKGATSCDVTPYDSVPETGLEPAREQAPSSPSS